MYDARKYSGGGSLKDGMAFGLFVVLAALVSFLAAFNMPGILPSSADQTAEIIDANANGKLTLPDVDASRLDAALRKFDADLHAKATARMATVTDTTLEAMGEAFFEEVGAGLATKRSDFANMPIRYLNQVINLSRDRLSRAEKSKNAWCSGSSYKDFMGITDPAQLAFVSGQMSEKMASTNIALSQYVVDASAILLEGATAARRSPTQLGPVSDQDEAALQGLILSLVTDQQVMPLMLAAQQGNLDSSLDSLNICSLGVTAITAVRTLPEETKGRVWKEIMLGDFDPAAIQ